MNTKLISLRDQLIVQYADAWKRLWGTTPPAVRKVGMGRVYIVSQHGSNVLDMMNFRARINDMRYWAEQKAGE